MRRVRVRSGLTMRFPVDRRETRQDKTRQSKTRQDKTRHKTTREVKFKTSRRPDEDQTRQDKDKAR